MPVPARKRSNAAGRRRRAHDALKTVVTTACPTCKTPILSHHACKACGEYKGKK